MQLIYPSGEPVMKGDRTRYHGEPSEVEFIADGTDPETDWFVQRLGVGCTITVSKNSSIGSGLRMPPPITTHAYSCARGDDSQGSLAAAARASRSRRRRGVAGWGRHRLRLATADVPRRDVVLSRRVARIHTQRRRGG